MRKAYFAGGCFWCITPVFNEYQGIISVISGYSGGSETNPIYEDVKKQKTGHRETIQIEYDESVISYERLVSIFMDHVNPFDDGGQYIDRGFSYTLAIYYQNEKEKERALHYICELEKQSKQKVYIQVEPFQSFWKAEEYHQDYYLKNPKEFELELIMSGRKKGDSI